MARVHIYTTFPETFLTKQSPGRRPAWGGHDFSFGVQVPENTDLLLVHRFASFAIPTTLPQGRTVFLAGEPAGVHPVAPAFLEQFGLVSATYPLDLSVPTRRENYRCIWYAGIDLFEQPWHRSFLDHDYYTGLAPRGEIDAVSVVTSPKTQTPLHRQRNVFIEALKDRLGDRCHLFGWRHRGIGDKAEALLPYRYHVALENTAEPGSWTEKLSDPLLCWAYPFHAGDPVANLDLPADAFTPIDVFDVERAVETVVQGMAADLWTMRRDAMAAARAEILERKNIMALFAELADAALAQAGDAPRSGPARVILPEHHFLPAASPKAARRIAREKAEIARGQAGKQAAKFSRRNRPAMIRLRYGLRAAKRWVKRDHSMRRG